MGKGFNLNLKQAPANAMTLGLTTGGIIASKKFLPLDKALMKMNLKPDSPLIKYQGFLKSLLALFALGMLPAKGAMSDFGKPVVIGIGLEGLITGLRQATAKTTYGGTEYLYDAIGQDEIIDDLEEEDETIEDEATDVSGEDDDDVTTDVSGVSGMGMGDSDFGDDDF